MNIDASDIEADIEIVDGLDTVTVLQINPDTGATIATSTDVTVLFRAEEGEEVNADDGAVIAIKNRFHLRASQVSFVPKDRDRIVDGDDIWIVGKTTKAAFATRYICDVVKYQG